MERNPTCHRVAGRRVARGRVHPGAEVVHRTDEGVSRLPSGAAVSARRESCPCLDGAKSVHPDGQKRKHDADKGEIDRPHRRNCCDDHGHGLDEYASGSRHWSNVEQSNSETGWACLITGDSDGLQSKLGFDLTNSGAEPLVHGHHSAAARVPDHHLFLEGDRLGQGAGVGNARSLADEPIVRLILDNENAWHAGAGRGRRHARPLAIKLVIAPCGCQRISVLIPNRKSLFGGGTLEGSERRDKDGNRALSAARGQSAWVWRSRLAEIPKQSRHDTKSFAGDRRQQVLIGRVLRAPCVRMRNPDGLESEHVDEDVVGQ